MSQKPPPPSNSTLQLTTDSPHASLMASRLFQQEVELRTLQQAGELHEQLGRMPDSPAAPQTALALAVVAWQQVTRSAAQENPAAAVGAALLTGRLADTRAKSSSPWVLAVQTATATGLLVSTAEHMASGSEPQRVADLLTGAASWLSDPRLEGAFHSTPQSKFFCSTALPAAALTELYRGRQTCVWQTLNGLQNCGPPGPYALLSGSFNPRHAGHVQLARAAAAWLKQAVHFELPVINADKPPLDYLSLNDRCRQFGGNWLALTAAPAFTEKARLFPGTVFVVGADTAERILQPGYYGGSEDGMRAALAGLGAQNCRFLVAARRMKEQLQTLQDLQVPRELGGLFEELPAEKFQLDVSSTMHRRQQACPYSFLGGWPGIRSSLPSDC